MEKFLIDFLTASDYIGLYRSSLQVSIMHLTVDNRLVILIPSQGNRSVIEFSINLITD